MQAAQTAALTTKLPLHASRFLSEMTLLWQALNKYTA